MTVTVILPDNAIRTYYHAYVVSCIAHKYRIIWTSDGGKSTEVDFAPEDAHIVIVTETEERKESEDKE